MANLPNDDAFWKKVSDELTKKRINANPLFARTVVHFSLTAFDALKMNAYMLSFMADCRRLSKEPGNVNQGDERESGLKDRRLHLIVKKVGKKTGAEQMCKLICPGKGEKGKGESLTKVLREEHNLTNRNYSDITELVYAAANAAKGDKQNEKKKGDCHTFNVAVQYLTAFVNFILWACDFANRRMTLEQVKKLIPLTEKAIGPMFERIRNGQGGVIGLRNFVTVNEQYVGNTINSLDQMFAEYRHKINEENAITNDITNDSVRTKSMVVLTLEEKKRKKKEKKK